ncbi:MAG: ABC transporter permease, partial [Candidatus Cloacimonetes bacterium]|nr:ABC transporter permease [Candidatus Cloacimonadota bacterium]
LFTLEGVLHAVLAIIGTALLGSPLLYYFHKVGLKFGEVYQEFGIAGMSDVIYLSYPWKLVVGTSGAIVIVTAIVSFVPTWKIALLKPTDALRGKMTRRKREGK